MVQASTKLKKRPVGISVVLGMVQGIFLGKAYIVFLILGIFLALIVPYWNGTLRLWDTVFLLDGGSDKIRSRVFMVCVYLWVIGIALCFIAQRLHVRPV